MSTMPGYMSNLSLDAKKRVKKTKLDAADLPAVVYGRGMEATGVSINTIEFKKLFSEAGESTIFNLSVDGEDHDVLVHDFQRDPVSYEVSHVDFYAIEKGQTITVSVPLEFVGEAPVKDAEDAQLVYVLHELEVKCQPKDLPGEIEVDISSVAKLGDAIHISDLNLPEGVESVLDADETVVSTSAVREEEEVEEEESEEIDFSEIAVEGQKETDDVADDE